MINFALKTDADLELNLFFCGITTVWLKESSVTAACVFLDWRQNWKTARLFLLPFEWVYRPPVSAKLKANGRWCQRHLFLLPSASYYKCSQHKMWFILLWWVLKSKCYAIISQWSNYNVLDENYQAMSRLDENLCTDCSLLPDASDYKL